MSEEDLRLLSIIRRNSGRIDDIVESVLQLSRRDQAAPRTFELGSWLEELCRDTREIHRLPREQLRLTGPDTDLEVEADPRHLHQVLSNLCDNALKHAAGGPVPVRIEIRALRDPVRGAPRVEVIDNGPGISEEAVREIFSPFYTTSSSGTGLGLYIAKELCETNGIELEYISQETGGACFRLSFPS
jgi:two-component system sensor histidine kinase PilS (NtrC family)